ncbi:hypothetical protein [Rothia halotolerans]|uniref:hypothetical protein n=1 Tax=Rothia halotolerans TaxID=405770 RepID=UPI00101C4627|nr:hypothetical protein [Rothia halotolerans]
MNDELAERLRKMNERAAPPLTWEEFKVRTPCRGCGQPWLDGEEWRSGGTAHFTDEQRERYEAEKKRFAQQHGRCGNERHSMSGSLTIHCRRCCPPPPLSPQQVEEIRRVFAEARRSRNG